MPGSSRASLIDYIELHAASAFSFLQGASLPEALVERAAALGYSALALLDADGVYGAPRFHKAAAKAGLRAIIGAELTIAPALFSPAVLAPAAFVASRPAPAPSRRVRHHRPVRSRALMPALLPACAIRVATGACPFSWRRRRGIRISAGW
jgi:hypothetical protein